METQTCISVPQDDGGLQIYSATQCPDYVLRAVAKATTLPPRLIRVEVARLGGAYGGKITRSLYASVACSVAAYLTGQPVRTQVSEIRESVFKYLILAA